MSDFAVHHEAEAATLCIIMLDPKDSGSIFNRLTEDDFHGFNRLVFASMRRLRKAGLDIDIATLYNEMLDRGELDTPGNKTRLKGLASAAPTSANGEYYSRIVLFRTLRREMDRIGNELITTARDDSVEISPVIHKMRDSLSDLITRMHL